MGCGVPPFGDPLSCVTDLAGGAASSIAGSAFGSIANDFGSAADGATQWLWGQIGSATEVSLVSGPGEKTFYFYLGLVASIALVIAFGLFIVQIITSVLKQDGKGLVRAMTGLVVAFLGASFAIGTTVLLLRAVDALSDGVLQLALGQSMQQLGNHLLGVGIEGAVTNPAGEMLLAIVVLFAVVIVWVALMIRKLLIIVSAVFAPLAFSGATARVTTGWIRKWIEMMVALIFSKLILIFIFIIGYGVLFASLGEPANPTGAQKITNVVVGVLILAMAGFAPWLAIKMVHFAGQHFEEVHRQASNATAGAQTVMAAPQKLGKMPGMNGNNGSPGRSGSSGQPGQQGPPGKSAPTPNAGSGSSTGGGVSAAAGSTAGAGGAAGAGAAGAGAGGAAAATPVLVGVAAKDAAQSAAGKVAAVSDQASGGSAPSLPGPGKT
jgi:type IV secretion system protein TrbL